METLEQPQVEKVRITHFSLVAKCVEMNGLKLVQVVIKVEWVSELKLGPLRTRLRHHSVSHILTSTLQKAATVHQENSILQKKLLVLQ